MQQAGPLMASQKLITDVTIENFMTEVMEASKERIILVDFWAPWCQACQQLLPVLEKLVVAYKGAVALAKVNIEIAPEIAQQMRIQSIPAVYAFFKGQPVDGFMGALPEAQIKSWIDRLVKATGGIAPQQTDEDTQRRLDEAQAALKAGDFERAESLYAHLMDDDPDNAIAYSGVLSAMIGQKKIAQAKKMLDMAPPEISKDKSLASVRAELELAEQSHDAGLCLDRLIKDIEERPDNLEARYNLALAYYAAGQKESAIDALLEIIQRNRSWNDDAARLQLLKFFEALGFNDPLAVEGRKKLSSILFS